MLCKKTLNIYGKSNVYLIKLTHRSNMEITQPEMLQKVTVDIYKLTCVNCMTFPAMLNFQCENGHFICDECESRKLKCSICCKPGKHTAMPVANLILDQIVRNCRNKRCREVNTHRQMIQHEMHCNIGKLECSTCKKFKGVEGELVKHYTEGGQSNTCLTLTRWWPLNQRILRDFDHNTPTHDIVIQTNNAPACIARFFYGETGKDAWVAVGVKMMTNDQDVVNGYAAVITLSNANDKQQWIRPIAAWQRYWPSIKHELDIAARVPMKEVMRVLNDKTANGFLIEIKKLE